MKWLGTLLVGAASFLLAVASARAENAEIQQFNDQVRAPLVARDFDALETLTSELRRDDPRFAGGLSRLYLFYRAMAGLSVAGNYWRDSSSRSTNVIEALDQFRLLQAWQYAKPNSTAPRIALALFWRDHAWQIRGNDWANKVLPGQWAGFRGGISEERKVLRDIVPTDPGVYNVLLSLARDERWPRDKLDPLYRAAVLQHPTFFHLYIQHAEALEPRWFGAPGELKDYAQSLLQDPGGDIGRMAYSLVAVEQFGRGYRMREFFDKTGLAWAEVQAGFELREQRYGLSNADWNLLLYFACAAPDRAVALRAVEHIGDEWAPWLWREKRVFEHDVARARSGG